MAEIPASADGLTDWICRIWPWGRWPIASIPEFLFRYRCQPGAAGQLVRSSSDPHLAAVQDSQEIGDANKLGYGFGLERLHAGETVVLPLPG